MEKVQITVFEKNAGVRLDKFLTIAFPEHSRNQLSKLLKSNNVRLDNDVYAKLSADYKVRAGQVFNVFFPEEQPSTLMPQEMSLSILYEDKDIVVLDKPAGVVVHPGAGNTEKTLVNGLLKYCAGELSFLNGENRPGVVHRIDKDTSGILVFAKNDVAMTDLAAQFAAHSVERVYQAFVYGTFIQPTGTVTGNIGRSSVNRQKMAIVQTGGKPAVTHYTVEENFKATAALVQCCLETGRTHQIRVHLTSIGHPLIGDQVYGNPLKGTPDFLRFFPRQALHAGFLGFIHPITGKKLSFETPLPPDLQELYAQLKEYHDG